MRFLRPKFVLFLIGAIYFTQEIGVSGLFPKPVVPTEIKTELENETKEELEILANSVQSKSNGNSKPYKHSVPNTHINISSQLTSGFCQKTSRIIAYRSLLI